MTFKYRPGTTLTAVAIFAVVVVTACGGSGAPGNAATPTALATMSAATDVPAVTTVSVVSEAPQATEVSVAADAIATPEQVTAEQATTMLTETAAIESQTVITSSDDRPYDLIVDPTTASGENAVLIDAGRDRGAISPLIFGANTGPLWVLLPAVWPKAEALGLNVIHFPGGEWGDQNDLTHKQVDDFVALSSRLGAEPLISVRAPGGTPEKAAALVDYANKQMGYDIEYWAIGNEPNLYPPIHTEEPWSPQYYADRWREIALAMKAVDPGIKLLGPEVTGYVGEGPGMPEWERKNAEWVRAFLETNGDLVDVVSIHRYPFPNSGGTQPENPTVEDVRTNPRELDDHILPELRGLIEEHTGRQLPVAITEYGLDSRSVIRGEAAPNMPISALWWGDVLMRLVDQKVDITTYWNLATRDAQSGHGIFTQYDVRPVYYTFQLFQQLGTQLLGADSSNPDVNVLAARRDDGALTIMLSNTSLEEQTVTASIDGFSSSQTVDALRVDGITPGLQEIDEIFTADESLTLPPLSLTLFALQGE